MLHSMAKRTGTPILHSMAKLDNYPESWREERNGSRAFEAESERNADSCLICL